MVTNARMRACACGVALFIGGAGVHAGLVEIHASDSYSETTDWTHTFELPQFDDMGGSRTLLAVVVTLDATIEALGQVENMESWEHEITLTLDAFVSLSFMDEPLVADTGVSKNEVFQASPFDGAFDFDGPSGGGFDLSGFDQASTSRSGAEDLSPWIGTGTVDIVGHGYSVSSAAGPGNVAFQFMTEAAGKVTVRYEYIPTPGALTIMAIAGSLLIPRRRRPALHAA